MTGERYVTADMDRIRADHGVTVAGMLSRWWEKAFTRWGSSAKQGYTAGVWAGVEWVLNAQHAIDDLTQGQLLAELRKGPGSIFWPLLSADPKSWVDCPRCERAVLIDREGLCPECAYEFEEDN